MDEKVEKLIDALCDYITKQTESKQEKEFIAENVKALAELMSARMM